MSCSVSSLLSDQMVTGGALAGGDSASWKKLLEDIKSFLRDEDNFSHLLLLTRIDTS